MTQAREERESQYRVIPVKLLGQLPPDGIVVVRVVETRVVDVAQNPRAVRNRNLRCTTNRLQMPISHWFGSFTAFKGISKVTVNVRKRDRFTSFCDF